LVCALGGVGFQLVGHSCAAPRAQRPLAFLASPSRSEQPALSRRWTVAGLVGAVVPLQASADVPIAFDYRTAEQIDPATRVVVGDLQSPEVQGAAAMLRKRRDQADGAVKRLEAEPTSEVLADLGIPAQGDTFESAIKSKDLNGPLAAAAAELRAAVKTIGDVMDGKTAGDTGRAGRIMLQAWYKCAQDPNLAALPNEGTDLTAFYIAAANRKKPEVQAALVKEVGDYVKALDFLLKFVE